MASDPGLFIGSSSSSSVRVAPYQKENTFHSPSHFSLSLAYEYFITALFLFCVPNITFYLSRGSRSTMWAINAFRFLPWDYALTNGNRWSWYCAANEHSKHSSFWQAVQQQRSGTERPPNPTNIIVSSKCQWNGDHFFRIALRSYDMPAIDKFVNFFLKNRTSAATEVLCLFVNLHRSWSRSS